MNVQTGIVDIRGRAYQTVALRVQTFRERHPEHSLTTEIVERDPECVVMRAIIGDASGRVIATGHSEEYRKSSQINRTSALENAETSAIGRALAAFGLGGTEFASANEVVNAIHQQRTGNGGGDNAESTMGPAAEPSNLRDQLEQSVAQEVPEKWTEPGSMYSGIHKLKGGLRSLNSDLEGCGDSGMVYGVTATAEWKEFVRVSELHCPHYLRGGDPAPPEFEGLVTKAERLVAEFDAAEAKGMVDMVRAG